MIQLLMNQDLACVVEKLMINPKKDVVVAAFMIEYQKLVAMEISMM